MPDLTITDLTVRYGRDDNAVTPLDGFGATVTEGSLAVLLGPSGCGKTTLLSCVAGIQAPTSGSIAFGDTEVVGLDAAGLTRYRSDTVGIVFQAFNLVPSLTAVENVMVPLRANGAARGPARERAVTLLTEMGLEDRLAHRPSDLSGGQQQRVGIARALAMNPPLIVADEPTASLDHVQVEVVLRILRGLTDRGCTVIVSTHDTRLVPLADQLIEMQAHVVPTPGRPTIEVHLEPGEVLFEQGAPADRIYDIVDGTIEITYRHPNGTNDVLATLGKGDQFGEMGPLFDLPRSASARATTSTDLLGHTVDAFRAAYGGRHLMSLVSRTTDTDAN